MTPYEDLYFQQVPLLVSYIPSTSKVHVMDNLLHNYHKAILFILNENLEMDQNHMKQQVDRHCLECAFEEGDRVFLCLQPYK